MTELAYVVNANCVHVKRWTKFFTKKGYYVHLITHNGSYDPEAGWTYPDNPFEYYKDMSNVDVHNVSRGFKRIYETRKIVKKIKPDILHGHSVFGQGFFGAFTGFHPYVVSAWGWDIRVIPTESFMRKKAVQYALNKADIIHTQDKLSRNIISKLCKYPDRIYVQRWGIDTKEFKPGNCDDEIRKKHQIKDGALVMSIRELTKKYNIIELFNAMPYVVEKIPNVKFLVFNDGYMKRDFQKMVKEKGITENVDFVGFVSFDMYKKYMASVDLFVDTFYPHDNRGGQMFGQGLLEAMASNTTTVVADRPTISEFRGKDKWYYGYLYRPGDFRDLADKIVKMLKEPDNMQRIKEDGLRTVYKDFDWNKNMEKIEERLYK